MLARDWYYNERRQIGLDSAVASIYDRHDDSDIRARVIDAGTESFVFEITGASDKLESFIALMIPLGLVEVSRTGIVAIARGPEGM